MNQKLTYKNKLQGANEEVTCAQFSSIEDAVLTVSSDRYVRVWHKRSNGNYWPSVCEPTPVSPLCLLYREILHSLLVGLDNGVIQDYYVSADMNRIDLKKSYHAHSGSVRAMEHLQDSPSIISVGADQCLQTLDLNSGNRVHAMLLEFSPICLQMDHKSNLVFVGGRSGFIAMLRVTEKGLVKINNVLGHSGSVNSLCWDPKRQLLFSAGTDGIITMWDLGSESGIVQELIGHRSSVTSLAIDVNQGILFSAGVDQQVVSWNIEERRLQCPPWTDGNLCENCSKPFIWNIRDMWDQKSIGVRRHHCRKCGKSLCDNCSSSRMVLPKYGIELPVRVCSNCKLLAEPSSSGSLASFSDCKVAINLLVLDPGRRRLLTVGSGANVLIWDVL